MISNRLGSFINWLSLLCVVGLALLLGACGSEEAPDDVAFQATVAAAVAATGEAHGAVNTAVAGTVVANNNENEVPPPATWTAIAQVNEDTPTPAATLPPPPTGTPQPTVTVAATITSTTNTPEPTTTAVPPTDTPAPAVAQPTSPPPPPPTPTTPPNPTLGSNILVNYSFEGGWYHLNGAPELQLPNGWIFEYDTGATGFGSEPWDVWVRPETRVLPDFQLPAGERGLFILEGAQTIKMFKGNGAISFRLMQDIALQPGTYVFSVNVFPDLVDSYKNGRKVWAGDPTSGEMRFITPDGGTGWILFPVFGQWNTLEHTFTLAEAQTVRLGVGIRGRYALSNNGFFLDNWSLRQLQS